MAINGKFFSLQNLRESKLLYFLDFNYDNFMKEEIVFHKTIITLVAKGSCVCMKGIQLKIHTINTFVYA